MKKYLWIAVLIAALALVFSGCPDDGDNNNNNNNDDPVTVNVTFDPNGGSGDPSVVKVEKGKAVAKPATNPTRANYTFVNWFETNNANPDTGTPFNFATLINEDKTLYAIWKQGSSDGPSEPAIADVVLIGDADTEYEFEDDFFIDLVLVDDIAAIRVKPDDDQGDEYRVQINFDPAVDISAFGTFEMDFFTDAEWSGDFDGVSFNVSLFVGDSWEKIILYTGGGEDGVREDLEDILWFESRELQGIEIYSEASTDFTNLYITRLEFTGTALPEPLQGEKVEATNIFATLTKNGTGPNAKISLPAGENKTYIYFDSYDGDGEVILIELKFKYGNPDGGGGNVCWLTVFDDNGEWDSGKLYIGWLYDGWGTDGTYVKKIPLSKFSEPLVGNNGDEIDQETLNCITLELEGGDSKEFTLIEVNFILLDE